MEIYETNQNLENSVSFRQHLTRTYLWMFFGVALTFAIAFAIGYNPLTVYRLVYNMPMLPLILAVAQIGVVVVLSARLQKLKTTTCKILFIVYAILTGFTFSTLFAVYSLGNIATAFLMAAIFFGCLAVIGLTTKRDLTKLGTICMAGLFAFVIYMLLAMVFSWDTNTLMFSIIGLVLFAGITAWDNQKVKKFYIQFESEPSKLEKLSIYSALELYLDFINIFLYILRIFGNRN